MIKLIIFDLDGTLVDSIHDIADAANKAIEKLELTPITLEQTKAYVGDGLKAFVKGMTGDRHEDQDFVKQALELFNLHYEELMLNKTRFYQGAPEFIKHCIEKENRKVGVITNKPEKQARVILRELGTPENIYVQIYGGDTFEVKKPHPKPLQEMMKLAKTEPHETLMIGDSRQDYEAAINAGTYFAGVSFGYNPRSFLESLGAVHFFDHFDELRNLLKLIRA